MARHIEYFSLFCFVLLKLAYQRWGWGAQANLPLRVPRARKPLHGPNLSAVAADMKTCRLVMHVYPQRCDRRKENESPCLKHTEHRR